jgi:hypothetical protein
VGKIKIGTGNCKRGMEISFKKTVQLFIWYLLQLDSTIKPTKIKVDFRRFFYFML